MTNTGAASYVQHLDPRTHTDAQIGFWITGTYTPASFVIWSSTGLNVAGRTKKSTAQAIVFVTFCTGFCIGPQLFFASSAPEYRPGLYFCCACFIGILGVIVSWFFWVRWENARRDRRVEAMGLTKEQQELEGCLFGLEDMTDRQVNFYRNEFRRMC